VAVPAPKYSRPETSRSVFSCGSRYTRLATRRGSAPKMKRESEML